MSKYDLKTGDVIDGFVLANNQSFQFANVDGNLFGEFSNFADGDLVGTFGGVNLYIDYQGGGGGGIALFSVPEPSSVMLILFGSAVCAIGRRRRQV